jgi:hypothetical protein
MLSLTVCFQGFEAIAGRYAKIAQHPCLIQKTQLPQRNILDIRR